ncbi:Uncharacterised protein [Chryseobacterium indoltheticum]|uniref:Uncharacterized protein n=1 Tax=Chryseobacterium indoltheticum TaxID=254 RepID=A0A381F9C4_9FLAO|nr:Uncharacterised protein [Chryseobacterium indoltheticum]
MAIHLGTKCKVYIGLLILLHSFLTQRFILKLYILKKQRQINCFAKLDKTIYKLFVDASLLVIEIKYNKLIISFIEITYLLCLL